MTKKIRKNPVIKQLGKFISDKIRVNGEPFELIEGFKKGTNENQAMQRTLQKLKERSTKTHEPYYIIGMWHGEADGIYIHRWAMINKETRELEEI